jgi:2-dehydro-3-deoxyphosphogalactonate aldolase
MSAVDHTATTAARLDELPLIAILRGVRPEEVVAVGRALTGAGFVLIEVPLNSPAALQSIRLLADALHGQAVIGAGTVMRAADAEAAAMAGATMVLSPNFDAQVVQASKRYGLFSMPGVGTATEGFNALASGADALKLFPSELLGPSVVKAWRAVFPKTTRMFSVGGIGIDNLSAYKRAGVNGAGIGSSLYYPGVPLEELTRRARSLVDCWFEIQVSSYPTN